MTHTPEPRGWTAFYKPKYDEWHVGIPAADAGWVNALCPDGILPGHPKDEREKAAKRIVSCVNGCAGLNPEAFREVVEALEWAMRELHGDNRYDDESADQQVQGCYDKCAAALAKARAV